ncbi:DUF192 domain-containing protein [Bacillus sp. RAR_GA_16]|uniref:DUF192 domain-containing protein n=1 Tax=Bacillus sp. RAR_GA_16 TaxID=2876774 RepID=UPI001CCD2661|nr:DUF192 domain-containing protein [Bacillus sp. RAR_GA_16]MCA0172573.1 DUF192 domain-containing protein [Bacillus sp. RAR_GA_16]
MVESKEHTLYRTLPLKVWKADTFTKRLKGLMFRKTPLHHDALLITPCNSIHMCFMFFSIDVVFLNEENQIIKSVKRLKPWGFVAPVKGASATLELPEGTIEELALNPGIFLNISID